MNQHELLNIIFYLVPTAKCSVWDISTGAYHGENNPININGYFIDWSTQNTSPCPTEEQVNACDPVLVANATESRRKAQRDTDYANDINMKANYASYLVANPGASFSSYLDYLESLHVS